MQYGILPLGKVETYVWRHDSVLDAKSAARDIAEKHHIEVIVFEIIGTYVPSLVWEPQEAK